MVAIHHFTIFICLCCSMTLMQTKRNRKEYQGIGAIEAIEYENARSDLVAITEKK